MSSEQLELDVKSRQNQEYESYRLEEFTRVLGSDWPLGDIKTLMESPVSPAELRELIKRGCPKGTAIRILL